MTDEIVVVGAGGFGRETLDVLQAVISAGATHRLLGVIDNGPRDVDRQLLAQRGITYLGSEEQWIRQATGTERFIVAIGDPCVRETVAGRFITAGLRPISVVHPRASVGSQGTHGAGLVVAAGAVISTNVTLGDHVHLNPGCIIGHDAALEDFVSVNPGAIVSGNVTIEKGALVGAGSVVLQGLRIASRSTIGASACVTKHVVEVGSTVVGIPARRHEKDSSVQ
ncbi:acetyltransferase [Microbacterium sp. NPDC058345]|uniref:acetyltransferase n=1 Tax=Microbacterium sp. NPDC058345 TaxID=3346455 RepID=UPI0036694C10